MSVFGAADLQNQVCGSTMLMCTAPEVPCNLQPYFMSMVFIGCELMCLSKLPSNLIFISYYYEHFLMFLFLIFELHYDRFNSIACAQIKIQQNLGMCNAFVMQCGGHGLCMSAII